MGTISLIYSPTWGLMVKKLNFTTYKLTKMMQMSDYVIKTNNNKPKTTLSLVFPILHAVAEVKPSLFFSSYQTCPDMFTRNHQKKPK
jgi:hypothetical protein